MFAPARKGSPSAKARARAQHIRQPAEPGAGAASLPKPRGVGTPALREAPPGPERSARISRKCATSTPQYPQSEGGSHGADVSRT